MSEENEVGDLDIDLSELFDLDGTADLPATISSGDSVDDVEVAVNYPTAPTTDVAITHQQRVKDSQTDYDYSRRTLHNSLELGSKALDNLVYFASNSGGPEAFKQVATLMDSLTKGTKQLIDLQNQMNVVEGIKTAGSGKQQAQTINNNTTIVTEKESEFSGMTREEAREKRKLMRELAASEKQVN